MDEAIKGAIKAVGEKVDNLDKKVDYFLCSTFPAHVQEDRAISDIVKTWDGGIKAVAWILKICVPAILAVALAHVARHWSAP